jgi:L-aspartate oxidase
LPLAAPSPITDRDAQLRHQIQRIMSSHVAVVRDAPGLRLALGLLDAVGENHPGLPRDLESLLLLAREVTRSALNREESRGGHYRLDFPETNPSLDGMHQVVNVGETEESRAFGPLGMMLSA